MCSPVRCNLMKRSGKSSTTERLTITLGGGQRQKIEAIAKDRRTSAATVVRWALDEYIIGGIKTTIEFHQKIMNNADFIDGDVDTSFLERIKL